MKWNYKLSLGMIAGLAIILPVSVFAQDQNQDQKKQEKGQGERQQRETKSTPQAVTRDAAPSGGRTRGGNVHNDGRVNDATGGQGHVSHVSSGPSAVQQSNISPVTTQNVQPRNRNWRGQQNQTVVTNNQRQYNKANHYGGLWFAADTHRDWDRNRQYSWNNHNYRWYADPER